MDILDLSEEGLINDTMEDEIIDLLINKYPHIFLATEDGDEDLEALLGMMSSTRGFKRSLPASHGCLSLRLSKRPRMDQ